LRGLLALLLLLSAACLAACTAAPSTPEPSVLDQAAAEATRIVQQAQATAMVRSAQATATAIYVQVVAQEPTVQATHTPTVDPTTALADPLPGATETPAVEVEAETQHTATPVPVEVISVGFAVERGLINVRFRAPPEEASKWWPGNVYVVDEQSGVVYNEIPVMPTIGPLIGRPKLAGQIGYVMLVNPSPYLHSGAQVTVVLGMYEFEHIVVQ
jgi:hypothetical protein